jgi:hypothetical protein
MGGDHHPHAGGDRLDGAAHLLHHPERFMAEHQARIGAGAAVVHVQIGAAEGTGRDLDQRVGVGAIVAAATSRVPTVRASS